MEDLNISPWQIEQKYQIPILNNFNKTFYTYQLDGKNIKENQQTKKNLIHKRHLSNLKKIEKIKFPLNDTFISTEQNVRNRKIMKKLSSGSRLQLQLVQNSSGQKIKYPALNNPYEKNVSKSIEMIQTVYNQKLKMIKIMRQKQNNCPYLDTKSKFSFLKKSLFHVYQPNDYENIRYSIETCKQNKTKSQFPNIRNSIEDGRYIDQPYKKLISSNNNTNQLQKSKQDSVFYAKYKTQQNRNQQLTKYIKKIRKSQDELGKYNLFNIKKFY